MGRRLLLVVAATAAAAAAASASSPEVGSAASAAVAAAAPAAVEPRSSGSTAGLSKPSSGPAHQAAKASAVQDVDRIFVQRLSSVEPNAVYPEACNSTVTFNDPAAWAHGTARMTVALVKIFCSGVSRQLHWHPEADEWGYVVRGEVITYVSSPDGLPWPSSLNRLGVHGVWHFPRGWLHGFTCVSDDGQCEVVLTFNTPLSVPVDNRNLDTTLAESPKALAAEALALNPEAYAQEALPQFAASAVADKFTSPLLILTKGLCAPHCPEVVETTAMPAVANLIHDGKAIDLPGGAHAFDMRTPQFPFAKTLSQELVQLKPGGRRGLNWVTNANALLVATSGSVEVQLQGGVTDETAHEAYAATLQPGDAFFVPIGRAYWLREVTGSAPAAAIVTFDVGEWQTAELGSNLRALPPWVVAASLRENVPKDVALVAAHNPLSALAVGSAPHTGASQGGGSLSRGGLVLLVSVTISVVGVLLAFNAPRPLPEEEAHPQYHRRVRMAQSGSVAPLLLS